MALQGRKRRSHLQLIPHTAPIPLVAGVIVAVRRRSNEEIAQSECRQVVVRVHEQTKLGCTHRTHAEVCGGDSFVWDCLRAFLRTCVCVTACAGQQASSVGEGCRRHN
jgi:hypothetical protein